MINLIGVEETGVLPEGLTLEGAGVSPEGMTDLPLFFASRALEAFAIFAFF